MLMTGANRCSLALKLDICAFILAVSAFSCGTMGEEMRCMYEMRDE